MKYHNHVKTETYTTPLVKPTDIDCVIEALSQGRKVTFGNSKSQGKKCIFDGGIDFRDFNAFTPKSVVERWQSQGKLLIFHQGKSYQYIFAE